MNVSFGTNELELKFWNDESLMQKYLNECNCGHILLGTEAEQKMGFHSLALKIGCLGKDRFGVGVSSEGHGLVPKLLLMDDMDTVILGFNSEVVGIKLSEKRIIFRIPLESLFRSLIRIKNEKNILIFHEIGVVALNINGKQIWKFDKDIIENYTIENGVIEMAFMDSKAVVISLENGNIVKNN